MPKHVQISEKRIVGGSSGRQLNLTIGNPVHVPDRNRSIELIGRRCSRSPYYFLTLREPFRYFVLPV